MINPEAVRSAASELNMSYAALGRSIGKSRSTVSRWATGCQTIPDPRMVGLAFAALFWRTGNAARAGDFYRAATTKEGTL